MCRMVDLTQRASDVLQQVYSTRYSSIDALMLKRRMTCNARHNRGIGAVTRDRGRHYVSQSRAGYIL